MKLRELQAMLSIRQVRASRNILAEARFLSLVVICAYSRKAVLLGFAQSVLKNVGSYDVASAL